MNNFSRIFLSFVSFMIFVYTILRYIICLQIKFDEDCDFIFDEKNKIEKINYINILLSHIDCELYINDAM